MVFMESGARRNAAVAVQVYAVRTVGGARLAKWA
jgi:hypothetical protein